MDLLKVHNLFIIKCDSRLFKLNIPSGPSGLPYCSQFLFESSSVNLQDQHTIPIHTADKRGSLSHLMRLWHFSSSVNSFFKRARSGARCLFFFFFFFFFFFCRTFPLFPYFMCSCVRTVKALARLRGCAGSLEPSVVAFVISTKIS